MSRKRDVGVGSRGRRTCAAASFWFISSCVGETDVARVGPVAMPEERHALDQRVASCAPCGRPRRARDRCRRRSDRAACRRASGRRRPARPAGVLSRESTASSSGLPVQVARSAALGPKPARQNSRSTIAGDIDVGEPLTTPRAGGTWRRWRRGLTVRALAGLWRGLVGFFFVAVIGYPPRRGSHGCGCLLHAPCTNALNAAAAAPLRGTRKSPVLSLTSYQTTPASFGMVLPGCAERADPGALVAAGGGGAGLGDPERLLGERLDRAVGRREQIGGSGPGQARALPKL